MDRGASGSSRDKKSPCNPCQSSETWLLWQVCTILNSFLLRQFPAEARERTAEMKPQVSLANGLGAIKQGRHYWPDQVEGSNAESLMMVDIESQEEELQMHSAGVDELGGREPVPLDPCMDGSVAAVAVPDPWDFSCRQDTAAKQRAARQACLC